MYGINGDMGIFHYKYFKGKQWLLIFHHNITGKNLFADEYEAVNCSADGRYSILAYVNDSMKIDDKFEFLLQYDFTPKYNMWTQANNPMLEREEKGKNQVDDFNIIHIDYNSRNFGGLALNTIPQHGCINSYIVGDLGTATWFYAIGQYANGCDKDFEWEKYIAGNGNNQAVWLYIRISPLNISVYHTGCKKRPFLVLCAILVNLFLS